MAPKTIKQAIRETLEDLSPQDLNKFRHQLLDRREEPRVRRARVEGKDFLDITDVLVSTFTESGALQVTLQILKLIDCHGDAETLAKETRGQTGSGDSATPPDGASGGNTMSADEHFVDKHKLELIRRVSHIAPILDELLYHKVLQQESFDQIMALSTSQDKMRALYSGCLKGGKECKDIFYKILEENERYLMDELKKKK